MIRAKEITKRFTNETVAERLDKTLVFLQNNGAKILNVFQHEACFTIIYELTENETEEGE